MQIAIKWMGGTTDDMQETTEEIHEETEWMG
jgi:hypothetical protein